MSANSEAIAWNREAVPPGAAQDAVIKGITGEMEEESLRLFVRLERRSFLRRLFQPIRLGQGGRNGKAKHEKGELPNLFCHYFPLFILGCPSLAAEPLNGRTQFLQHDSYPAGQNQAAESESRSAKRI